MRPVRMAVMGAVLPAAALADPGVVTVTGVIADVNSVKIEVAAVPGAADYRVYDVNLSPASDPIQNWFSFNGPVNRTNTALFVQIFGDKVTRDVMRADPANPTGARVGRAGQAVGREGSGARGAYWLAPAPRDA